MGIFGNLPLLNTFLISIVDLQRNENSEYHQDQFANSISQVSASDLAEENFLSDSSEDPEHIQTV